jgi:hypothetical protein
MAQVGFPSSRPEASDGLAFSGRSPLVDRARPRSSTGQSGWLLPTRLRVRLLPGARKSRSGGMSLPAASRRVRFVREGSCRGPPSRAGSAARLRGSSVARVASAAPSMRPSPPAWSQRRGAGRGTGPRAWRTTPHRAEGRGEGPRTHGHGAAPGEQQGIASATDVLGQVLAHDHHGVLGQVDRGRPGVGLGRAVNDGPVVQLHLRPVPPAARRGGSAL